MADNRFTRSDGKQNDWQKYTGLTGWGDSDSLSANLIFEESKG